MTWKILCGNVLNVANDLEPESVQCVVTSPPYWGLRKYKGEQDYNWNGWKGAYGLEPTPEMYVEHTIEILRAIKRVLRKDGVVFWNIGDSYYSSASNQQGRGVNGSNAGTKQAFEDIGRNILPRHDTIKPKDLCLIPFRVAIAAQSDGWWVRSIIIWSKPNPMPESVKDRPTDAHEYILMLTKSRKYYWDQDAVREPHARVWTEKDGGSMYHPEKFPEGSAQRRGGKNPPQMNPLGRNTRTVWQFPTKPFPGAHFAVFPPELPKRCIMAASREGDTVLDPFAGAGTTLLVAEQLNRDSIGIELSAEYCAMAVRRIMGGK